MSHTEKKYKVLNKRVAWISNMHRRKDKQNGIKLIQMQTALSCMN